MKKVVVFTDLDGTLLDEKSYSFEPARPALEFLRSNNVPLVICSSKTRAEIELYRRRLENSHPFVSENGGGIFIPSGYFGFPPPLDPSMVTEEEGYTRITLGERYSRLREAVHELRDEGFDVRGFGDMDESEVAEMTGISLHEAKLAKMRDFDETFIFGGTEEQKKALERSIRERGLNYTRGRYFHIMGDTDKGKAVDILIGLYGRKYGDITTVALGDSLNDRPMLRKVDHPVLLKKGDGSHDPQVFFTGLMRARGSGPAGWNEAVLGLLAGQDT